MHVLLADQPVKRPVLRWHGGKFAISPWVISNLPKHDIYIEPYGGAASVLLTKPRSNLEVLGDLDHELIVLFSVLRDPVLSERLREVVELTPYSRDEFDLAFTKADSEDVVEVARRMVVRHAMGVSVDRRPKPNETVCRTGFRDFTGTARSAPVKDWVTYPRHIASWCQRLAGVLIKCDSAQKTMSRHDRADALHYVDPPYMMSERRSGRRGYAHDMDDADHAPLLEFLKGLKGMVVLSGYPNPLYDELLPDWTCVTTETTDLVNSKRIECLWLSPSAAAAKAKENRQGDLFA